MNRSILSKKKEDKFIDRSSKIRCKICLKVHYTKIHMPTPMPTHTHTHVHIFFSMSPKNFIFYFNRFCFALLLISRTNHCGTLLLLLLFDFIIPLCIVNLSSSTLLIFVILHYFFALCSFFFFSQSYM